MVLVAIITILVSGCVQAPKEIAAIPTPTATIVTLTSTSTLTATPTPTWKMVGNWSGRDNKNTETFHISSHEWELDWKTGPGSRGETNFIIKVYKDDGTYVTLAANTIGADENNLLMRGSGDYYLTINTGQPYFVMVIEKQ